MTSQILSTSKPSSALRPALVRTDSDRENRGLVDKRPKRQVSFDETADGYDGLVLQVREEPSLYRASLDYLKRNSWLATALLLITIVILAAMPSIINLI